MFITSALKWKILESLPKGGIVAEIGTYKGEMSRAILDICDPKKLFLIDCWEMSVNLQDELAFHNHDEGEVIYQGVLNYFSNEIKSKQIEIVREYSTKCFNRFPNNFFDWIFIDADHTYNGVMNDLVNFSSKVKDGGFILGHDYTNHEDAKKQNFGVVEAVNDFVIRNKYQFLALTLYEGWPTYVISKTYHQNADVFLMNLARNSEFVLEIEDFLNFKYQHKIFDYDNKRKLIPKISKKG